MEHQWTTKDSNFWFFKSVSPANTVNMSTSPLDRISVKINWKWRIRKRSWYYSDIARGTEETHKTSYTRACLPAEIWTGETSQSRSMSAISQRDIHWAYEIIQTITFQNTFRCQMQFLVRPVNLCVNPMAFLFPLIVKYFFHLINTFDEKPVNPPHSQDRQATAENLPFPERIRITMNQSPPPPAPYNARITTPEFRSRSTG